MGNKKRASNSNEADTSNCYEGERLSRLLKSIHRGIESAKLLELNSLPEKFWYKQQFAVGVNEVTRVLERMPPAAKEIERPTKQHRAFCTNPKAPVVNLQAVLLASDCHPKWLTKHLPSLASSRNVSVIHLKDQKGGSLRLGELVKVKTAMALGIKARGNDVNEIVERILRGHEACLKEEDAQESTELGE
ncbi:hypothetical protein K2173_005106 [Erythroxylum novogranatense]|uniref:Ribosomal protein eL8/eL30/eS12/Gadd45 domain-containing protein n=1 Tax=Erythroxylum novogranatense TaxID=1862640 RepID=A0AAV8U8M3_9ROSI|nr:hypothetical protein K2173_005106 [Erythroxylum novogranatense]